MSLSILLLLVAAGLTLISAVTGKLSWHGPVSVVILALLIMFWSA